ncbi:MAG: hypothetical protein NTZ50_05535 [Chloroflexi bacterium]|nr:hypothetical protein [Chloroflexota bacterium]
MPVVHRLEAEYADRVEFQSLNIDEPATLDAQQKYRFIGQPQFVIVHANGEILASRNGIFTYEQLKGDIEKALAKSK